ncbi:MAG: amidase [Verrucomicrobiaceae bacterium]|nr:MAG: amidase [Verrucomicrobiaceae bacterium]
MIRHKSPYNRKRNVAALAAAVALGTTFARGADEAVSFELENATMEDVQKAMDAGALTSVELSLLYLNRIEAYDKTGLTLNTVPAINPRLIAEAAHADRLRANGVKLGPLQGIPFTAKGSFNFAGLPNTDGITVWSDLFPSESCFVIQKLQDAGAVFLGHANLDAFQASTAQANSQVWGLARNPYNPEFRTGGSSGGSGAATGGNLSFFSLGGETGGSVRSPSDRGGIVGIKTSNALISVRGLAPLAWDRDVVGPMARHAKDTAHIMDAATVEDSQDIWASVNVVPGRAKPTGYANKAATTTLAGKRFGVPLNMLGTSTGTVADEIRALFAKARVDMETAGATIVEVTVPPELDISFTGRRASVPASVVIAPTRKLYSPANVDTTGNMVGTSRGYPFKTFLEAILATPEDTVDSLHDKVVARISPVTQLPQSSRDAIAAKTTVGPTSPDAVEHFEAVRYQVLDYEAFLAANNLDALIMPTAPVKTATGITLPPISRALVNSFSNPFVTVPMGNVNIPLGETTSSEPSTLGFLGRFWGDDEVLALAAAYEAITKHRVNSPLVPPLAGENFDYTIEEILPPSKPPVIETPVKAVLKGKGKKARLVFEGTVTHEAELRAVRVSIGGKRAPVSGEDKWKSVVPVSDLLKRINPRTRTVSMTVIARDTNGNTAAVIRKVRIPKLDRFLITKKN